MEFLRQHPNIQGDHPARCQNPFSLRQINMADLKTDQLHCFHAIVVDSKEGLLLNCDVTQSYKNVHWLYEYVYKLKDIKIPYF